MILDSQQATKYNRELKARYNIDKDYTHLFSISDKFVTTKDKPLKKKSTSSLTDSRVRKSVEDNMRIEIELMTVYHCHNYRPEAQYDLNDDSRFDMKVTYTGDQGEKYYSYVEIKDDQLAHKTGNVVIEFQSRNKPSGISITESTQWVIRIKGFYLVMKSHELINFINKKGKKNPFPVVQGGDDYTSSLYKIKVKDIMEIVDYVMVDEFSEIYH